MLSYCRLLALRDLGKVCMWLLLIKLTINNRTQSSIEWMVYKPGFGCKSGKDLASWWTTPALYF